MRKPVAKDLDLANQLTIWESLFRQSLHMPQRLPNRLVVPWLDRVQGVQPSGVHIQQYAIEVDDWLRKNCGGNRAVHTTWSRRAWYLRAVPRGKMEGMQLIRLCLTDLFFLFGALAKPSPRQETKTKNSNTNVN